MRHREVDRARPDPLRPRRDRARQPHGRLRAAGDLDLLPGERARDPEPERLPDRLLARETAGVALRRVRARVAVRLLGRREAAVAEALAPLERPPDPLDLD